MGIICKDKQRALSQAKLKELLHYDPSTGIFTNRESRGPSRKGAVAGCLHALTGYVDIKINGVSHKAHRMAFLYVDGQWPTEEIDHENRVRHDNRWSNIREATPSDNGKNKNAQKNNTSEIPGVTWGISSRKWRARINPTPENRINIGRFDTLLEAALARYEAEIYYQYTEWNSQSSARAYVNKIDPFLIELPGAIKARWRDNKGQFKPSTYAKDTFLRRAFSKYGL